MGVIKALENPSADIGTPFSILVVHAKEWESILLRVDAAKNTDYIKKCYK